MPYFHTFTETIRESVPVFSYNMEKYQNQHATSMIASFMLYYPCLYNPCYICAMCLAMTPCWEKSFGLYQKRLKTASVSTILFVFLIPPVLVDIFPCFRKFRAKPKKVQKPGRQEFSSMFLKLLENSEASIAKRRKIANSIQINYKGTVKKNNDQLANHLLFQSCRTV